MITTTIPGRRTVATRRRRKPRRGAVAVELALTLTILILPMLLGIWEISCMADANRAINQAAGLGARQASTGLMTNAQVQQAVIQALQQSNVSTTGVVVTVTNSGSGNDASQALQNDPLTVSITLPFRNVDWSLTQKYTSDSSVMTAYATKPSQVDVPYTVSQTGPVQ